MSACFASRGVRHAWRDERAADCLRFASPAEALGGWRLGGWRLGGFEASRLVVSLIV